MRFIRLIIVLVILLIAGYVYIISAPNRKGNDVAFTIQPGQNLKLISRNLKDAGLIRSAWAFQLFIERQEVSDRVQAGIYTLSSAMSMKDIIALVLDTTETHDVRLTFIEGWRIKDYAELLEKHGFDAEVFLALASEADHWRADFQYLNDIPAGQGLEGYLFPDTYFFSPTESAEDIIRKMLNNFVKKYQQAIDGGNHATFGTHEVVTLASIIENEVRYREDRLIVAGLFQNRLQINMALQSDATINFLTDSGRSRSTAEDLAIDSPYNTYKYSGLPPGPISNPGRDSIEAVLRPRDTDYVYFLTDENSIVHYGRNFDEHQRNRELYF